MRKLAERADVAVATLYNQFADRNGVLVAFVSNGLDELELRSTNSRRPIPSTARGCCSALSTTRSDRRITSGDRCWRRIGSSPGSQRMGAVGDRIIASIEIDLAKARAAGLFFVDCDTDRLARHVFVQWIRGLERWAHGTIDWATHRSNRRARPRTRTRGGARRTPSHRRPASCRDPALTVRSSVGRRCGSSPRTGTAGMPRSPRSSRPGCSHRSNTRVEPTRSATRWPPTTGSNWSSPTTWAATAIEAVHDPGLVRFLERAWAEYQVRHPGTHDVVPDVFAMPGLVDGIGAFPERAPVDHELGRWCFETTTPITEGTYDAARSAVDIAFVGDDGRARWSPQRVRALPATRTSRSDEPLRRLLLLQQRCGGRPPRRRRRPVRR